jgi:hypothetical protein
VKSRRLRHIIAAGVIILTAIILYMLVVPTAVGRHYLTDMQAALSASREVLKKAADGTALPLFRDPDISLPVRSSQIRSAIDDIARAEDMLARLESAGRLVKLPGGNFANTYRTAEVRHKQSQALVSQSRQVLDEYRKLLTYLQTYTDMQMRLDEHLASFNNIHDFNTLIGNGGSMISTANALYADADKLRNMPAPAGFEQLGAAGAATLSQAANNFAMLGRGLNTGNDAIIYTAVAQLEAIELKNTVEDKDLLVSLADKSPILRELADLPEKAETALGL